jgi:hypothetical protein
MQKEPLVLHVIVLSLWEHGGLRDESLAQSLTSAYTIPSLSIGLHSLGTLPSALS